MSRTLHAIDKNAAIADAERLARLARAIEAAQLPTHVQRIAWDNVRRAERIAEEAEQ